jgi:hypothetical protein
MSEASKRKLLIRDDELLFTVAMAASFFDLTADSLRKKEKYLCDMEITRTTGNQRRYSLNDILRIAHALRRVNKMTDRQLRLIILRVDAFKEPVLKHRKKFRKGNSPS